MSSGTNVITAGNHPDVPGAVQMCSALSKALELLTALLLLGFTAIRRHFFSIHLSQAGAARVVRGKCPPGFCTIWICSQVTLLGFLKFLLHSNRR